MEWKMCNCCSKEKLKNLFKSSTCISFIIILIIWIIIMPVIIVLLMDIENNPSTTTPQTTTPCTRSNVISNSMTSVALSSKEYPELIDINLFSIIISSNISITFNETKMVKQVFVFPYDNDKIDDDMMGKNFQNVSFSISNNTKDSLESCVTYYGGPYKNEPMIGPIGLESCTQKKANGLNLYSNSNFIIREMSIDFVYEADASSGSNLTVNAFDGNMSTLFTTDEEIYPYFELDLAVIKDVKGIKLNFKGGWNADKFSNVTIRVGNQKLIQRNCNNTLTYNELCTQFGTTINNTVQTEVKIFCSKTLKGRFVTLISTNPIKSKLAFNEISIIEETLFSSSVEGENYPWNLLLSGKYFESKSEIKPWIIFDLGEPNKVINVTLYLNGGDKNYFKDIQVRVGFQKIIAGVNDIYTVLNKQCGSTYLGPPSSFQKEEFNCGANTFGRYITFQRISNGVLRIDEFKVDVGIIPTSSNSDKDIFNLIDDNLATVFVAPSIKYSWIQLYLGYKELKVIGIEVKGMSDFNNIDIRVGNVKNFYLYGSKDPFKSNALCLENANSTTTAGESLNCTTPLNGKYINIQKLVQQISTFTLGEVKVIS